MEIKEKLKALINSTFVRNVAIMSMGAAGAQVVTLILTPIITRLYGPNAFGLMGTFTAIMNIIIPIAALQYPTAIVIPKSDWDARVLIRLSLYLTASIAAFSLFLFILFKENIVNVFGINEISSYLYLIPLIILFSGLMQVMEQWLIRKEQFKVNAHATFYQSLIINTGKVSIGSIYPTAGFLIFLTALNNGLRALLMLRFSMKKKVILKFKHSINIKDIINLAKKYYEFPLYRAPVQSLNAVSQGLPVLMLTIFFGPASAGFYTLGRTTLTMPSRLIGKSVEDVFYPRIAEAINNESNITKIIKKSTLALAAIGVLPFGIVILFGPFLFNIVFGNDWIIAGEYARWIALLAFVQFIMSPSVRSLVVLNSQKIHLIYTVFMMVVSVIALATGYYIFANDIYAVAFFILSGVLLNLGLILSTFKISKKWNDIR